MMKTKKGGAYQLRFSTKWLCLSTRKLYKAAIINGCCVDWCETDQTFDYTELLLRPKDWDYKVVTDINCWDLLAILESEYNHTDDLVELCYSPIQNEFTDDEAP